MSTEESLMQPANLFIVDWDLPASDPSGRVMFHRALKRLSRDSGSAETRSTMSVLKTDNVQFAWQVYKLALWYGKANIYQVQQLNAGSR